MLHTSGGHPAGVASSMMKLHFSVCYVPKVQWRGYVIITTGLEPQSQQTQAPIQHAFGRIQRPVARQAERVREIARAVPPTSLALLSILSVQVGAALAKGLFPA